MWGVSCVQILCVLRLIDTLCYIYVTCVTSPFGEVYVKVCSSPFPVHRRHTQHALTQTQTHTQHALADKHTHTTYSQTNAPAGGKSLFPAWLLLPRQPSSGHGSAAQSHAQHTHFDEEPTALLSRPHDSVSSATQVHIHFVCVAHSCKIKSQQPCYPDRMAVSL